MDEASVYMMQINRLSDFLGSVIAEVPADVFNQRPGQHLNSISWNYFHLLRLWDFDLNWICRGQQREQDAWHRGGYTEKSSYNPDGKGTLGLGVGYGYTDAEVDETIMDVDVLRQYHAMLLAETAAYLGAADDTELRREAALVVNPDTTDAVANRIQHMIAHSNSHIGEIIFIKGMFGMYDPSYREAIA